MNQQELLAMFREALSNGQLNYFIGQLGAIHQPAPGTTVPIRVEGPTGSCILSFRAPGNFRTVHSIVGTFDTSTFIAGFKGSDTLILGDSASPSGMSECCYYKHLTLDGVCCAVCGEEHGVITYAPPVTPTDTKLLYSFVDVVTMYLTDIEIRKGVVQIMHDHSVSVQDACESIGISTTIVDDLVYAIALMDLGCDFKEQVQTVTLSLGDLLRVITDSAESLTSMKTYFGGKSMLTLADFRMLNEKFTTDFELTFDYFCTSKRHYTQLIGFKPTGYIPVELLTIFDSCYPRVPESLEFKVCTESQSIGAPALQVDLTTLESNLQYFVMLQRSWTTLVPTFKLTKVVRTNHGTLLPGTKVRCTGTDGSGLYTVSTNTKDNIVLPKETTLAVVQGGK